MKPALHLIDDLQSYNTMSQRIKNMLPLINSERNNTKRSFNHFKASAFKVLEDQISKVHKKSSSISSINLIEQINILKNEIKKLQKENNSLKNNFEKLRSDVL